MAVRINMSEIARSNGIDYKNMDTHETITEKALAKISKTHDLILVVDNDVRVSYEWERRQV
jgi:hypothetical protein